MIRLKTKCKTLEKQNKNSFIPFQNERDNLGRIIRPKVNRKNDYNIMELFENLKKSTKEYFFDKEFQKMERKFSNVKRSLDYDRDYNYEKQVNNCINIINKMMESKAQGQQNKQNLYINLRQKINNKISGVTSCLKKAKHKRYDQNFDQHPPQTQMQSKTVGQFKNTSKSQYILKQLEKQPRKINIELFKSLSSRSEMMATFCENGLKYSKFVHQKSFNPWKKWYKTNQFQIFPGKVVQVRCLQKSIYQ